MEISSYRGLISKVLTQCSGKKMSADEVAEQIITRIQDVELVIGGAQTSASSALTVALPPLRQDFSNIAAPATAPSVDLSQRIGTAEEAPATMIERYTVEDLKTFAANQMPSMLQVQPEGFDKPFEIQKFVEAAPGDIGFVRIVYQQPQAPMMDQSGQRIGPTVQIATTNRVLNADELTEEIIKQAKSIYTKTPRVLVPKFTPRVESVGDLRGALSAEAPGDGSEGLTMPKGGQMSTQWQAQRRRG